MLELSAPEISSLGDGGFVLRDGYLGAGAGQAHAEALALGAAMRPARIRSGDEGIRGDDLLWVEPPALPAARAAFADLQNELNREVWLGLTRFEMQLARYAPGAAYARHRDAFRGARDSRRATAILYLNPGWVPGDGGELRLHLPGGPVDVAPLLDRLVVFLSPLVEHEVLPARAPRLALTAWYYGPSPALLP